MSHQRVKYLAKLALQRTLDRMLTDAQLRDAIIQATQDIRHARERRAQLAAERNRRAREAAQR